MTPRMVARLVSGWVLVSCATWPLPGQQVREQVTVDAVQVRVVAVDATGARFEGLKPEDLTLRVDGRVVPIDTFALAETPMSPTPTPRGPRGTSVEMTTPRASSGAPAAVVMIVVDESTTAIPIRKEALGQLMRFVETDVRASGILVATYRLGSLHVDLPWTTDRARVLSTLRNLRDHPTVEDSPTGVLTSRTSVLEFQMFRARLQTALMQALAMFPDGPMTRQLLIVTGGRTLAPTLDVAGTLAGQGGGAAGPRLGTGREMVADPAAVDAPADPLGDGFELWSLTVGGALSSVDNSALEAKAIERDVALVPIATSRMQPGGYGDVERKANNQSSGLSAEVATNQALWGLARETGGGSVILAGKAASELAHRNERAGYLMSFRYGSGETGRFHRIQLTSNRPGVSLEYRRGFRIRTAEERLLDTVFAQVVLPYEGLNDLALAASLAPAGVAGDRTLLTLRFSPPAESGAAASRSVELVAVGRDAEGLWTQPVRWSGEATGVGQGIYEARIELAIAPGSRVWSVGLRDSLTAVDGYALVAPPKR